MAELSIIDRLEKLMHDLRLEYQEYIDLREIRYEVERLQAENADLRERLERAVELPCKLGDTIYKVYNKCDGHNCPFNGYYGKWRCDYEGERRCGPFISTEHFCYDHIPFINKTVFTSKEAAEALLAELKGKER